MDHFVHRENIALYKRLLADPSVSSNPARHEMLIRLLVVAEAKEKSHEQE